MALAGVLIIAGSSLTACSSNEEAKKDITIGFVVHVIGNPFIQQIIEGAEMAAADLGVTLKVAGPAGAEGDAQLTAVQNMAASGVDGIATSVPSASMVNGLNEIIKSGIPIVQFNGLGVGVNAPYVGEKSVASGRILGDMVLEKSVEVAQKAKLSLVTATQDFRYLRTVKRAYLRA